ncbi:MAG: PAS domain-containing protein, partial [Alkalinema sp. RL_2_19]|nr:PAS domain-containing protein [Alkalinema sp. RL_2_19]
MLYNPRKVDQGKVAPQKVDPTAVNPQNSESPLSESPLSESPLPVRSGDKFKWPLRLLLTVPIVLPVLGAVGVVGFLSWRSRQTAINDLAHQLMAQVSDSAQQHLSSYTNLPPQLAAMVAQDVGTGQITIDPADLSRLDRYFVNKSQAFPDASFIYLGTNRGHLIGAGFPDRTASLQLKVADSTTLGQVRFYRVKSDGRRGQPLASMARDDLRRSPWYQAGMVSGQPAWTEPYLSTNSTPPGLTLTAVQPLQQKGQIVGVAAVDLFLGDLSRYLKSLPFSRSGQIFILEPNGGLIAASTDVDIVRTVGPQVRRLSAYGHDDPILRETMEQLRGKLATDQQIQAVIAGKSQFIRVTPWRTPTGLNWRIVVVVPEQEFTQQIQANNHIAMLLSGLTLLTATALSYWIAQRVTRPILQLSQATKEVAHGYRRQIATPQKTWELEELTDSVNHMAARLQRSLANLSTLNQELCSSKQRLYQMMEALPVGVVVIDPDGKCLYLNRTGQLLLGLKQIPQVPLNRLSRAYRMGQAGTNAPYPTESLPIVQALQGKAVYVDDLEVRFPNTTIPLEARAIPVVDATGKVIYAIQTFQNVSARKQAELARSQS